jgi:molybdenum cofactor cytidylyltransferase
MEGVWTVILAAGASRRFNGIKALAPWGNGTLLSQAIDTARAFSGDNFLVVTGAHRAQIEAELTEMPFVYNESWEKGMGTSIACGVAAVLNKAKGAGFIVLMTVDQPHVTPEHLALLVEKSRGNGLCTLSRDGETDMPPAVLTPDFFKDAIALQGDRGLKPSLGEYNTVASSALRDYDARVG